MSYSIDNYSKNFNDVNTKVRAHWHMGREAARNVAIKLNELVGILHKDHPDWSINKIAHAIWTANEDLEGFTTRTIYNNLNEDNKALLDVTKQNNTSRKNVLEQSVETFQHNDIEDSSSPATTTTKTTLPTAYDVMDAETSKEDEQLQSTIIKPELASTNNGENITEIINEKSDNNISITPELNESINQEQEIETLRRMLFEAKIERQGLINEIRELRGAKKVPIPQEDEIKEEITEEKIRIEAEKDMILDYEDGKVGEFIDYWYEMKRLFKELVEIELKKQFEEKEDNPGIKISIQDAIYNVMDHFQGDGIRGLNNKRLKFSEGLARYISQYFIDKKTELYFRYRFRTPRVNEDTLGFNKWYEELSKTPKQRKEDERLFIEQCRKNTKLMVERINKNKLHEDDHE